MVQSQRHRATQVSPRASRTCRANTGQIYCADASLTRHPYFRDHRYLAHGVEACFLSEAERAFAREAEEKEWRLLVNGRKKKIDNDEEASACLTHCVGRSLKTIANRCSRFITQRRCHVDNRGMCTLSRADETRADVDRSTSERSVQVLC